MRLFQPSIISITTRERPALELDLGSVPSPPAIANWQSIVEGITLEWVTSNQYDGTGTLWMWQSHSQRFHADGVSVFISQCGLPKRFLKHLEQQLARHFGGKIEYGGTFWVQREKGWQPFCHIENHKIWKPQDTVGASWVEVN